MPAVASLTSYSVSTQNHPLSPPPSARAYQQGYAHLLELPTTDLTLCELKVVAAMLSFKVCRLAFRQNLPRDAIAHFRRHVELFRARVGPQELAVEHSGWLAQQ